MKKIFLLLTIAFAALSVHSQDVVFSDYVDYDTVIPTYGKNLKHYRHLYIGYQMPINTDEDISYTKPFLSSKVNLGLRYKRKLNSTFAFGCDLAYEWATYPIEQKKGKTIVDTILHDKEKFKINSFQPSVYFRINYGRRGNHIGNYIDLGAAFNAHLLKSHATKDKIDGEIVRCSTSKLKYIVPASYSALMRIGFNRYAITANYRLSNLFDSKHESWDLPKLSVGLEIGMF